MFICLFGQLAVMSAFLGPDQAATETLLATDPDVSPWVQKYQRSRETVSQTDYEVRVIFLDQELEGLKSSVYFSPSQDSSSGKNLREFFSHFSYILLQEENKKDFNMGS